MKKIIIVADASTTIGSGHVMRCLTIAHNLTKQGCHVSFLMQKLPGNLIHYVEQQGFRTIRVYEKANLYIIDHYEIGLFEEQKMRAFAPYIMVIDDLANRKHDCDLLLDQNVTPHYETRYEGLIADTCVTLLGPTYLIMRDEFLQPVVKRDFDGIKRLLVFMGGSDPTHETLKVLEALKGFNLNYIDVVVGDSNLDKATIKKICDERGYYYHQQISYLADLMRQADFSLGAGGATTWERCFVGLPSACTIVADNQKVGTAYAGELGACINLGWHENVTPQTYKNILEQVTPKQLQQISEKGLAITASKQPNAWLPKIMELIQ